MSVRAYWGATGGGLRIGRFRKEEEEEEGQRGKKSKGLF
jgi:hypothetical protein